MEWEMSEWEKEWTTVSEKKMKQILIHDLFSSTLPKTLSGTLSQSGSCFFYFPSIVHTTALFREAALSVYLPFLISTRRFFLTTWLVGSRNKYACHSLRRSIFQQLSPPTDFLADVFPSKIRHRNSYGKQSWKTHQRMAAMSKTSSKCVQITDVATLHHKPIR